VFCEVVVFLLLFLCCPSIFFCCVFLFLSFSVDFCLSVPMRFELVDETFVAGVCPSMALIRFSSVPFL
jgi:hypothetical protein